MTDSLSRYTSLGPDNTSLEDEISDLMRTAVDTTNGNDGKPERNTTFCFCENCDAKATQ